MRGEGDSRLARTKLETQLSRKKKCTIQTVRCSCSQASVTGTLHNDNNTGGRLLFYFVVPEKKTEKSSGRSSSRYRDTTQQGELKHDDEE